MRPSISPQIDSRSNFLEKIYNRFIKSKITNSKLEEEKWEIYNSLFNLFKEYGLQKIIDEIRYRITGGESENEVFLDVLTKYDTLPIEFDLYKSTLYDIEDKEWIENFC